MAWVPTVTARPGKIMFLQLTNVGTHDLGLNFGAPLALWMTDNMIPRSPGYVSVGSRRYNEWQTLEYEPNVEREAEEMETYAGPLIDHTEYTMPTQILTRSVKEAEDNEDPAGIKSRSQPDGGEIESRSGLRFNVTVEIHEDHTEREDDDSRYRRSMKESCAVKTVGKAPG